ncbi:MAG: MFS transporter [Candidatus Nealsonbacteria bacterium]|nr:MFS transporter [Candidatus Nealsonbacteria bacterium]
MNKPIKILSFGFLLIFLGFNGVQSYVTAYFSDANMAEVGFRSLILIYLFFILFNPVSAIFVSRYGAKKCMMAASIFYSFFILSLLSGSVILIYIFSALLGMAAAFLWTGQGSYLIRASDEKSYGANAGFFNSQQSLGSAAGVLFFGFLVSVLFFKSSFLLFSILPIVGFLLLSRLENIKSREENLDRFKLARKSLSSKTALRLSGLYFSFMFVFGLVIGILPIEIKNIIGAPYIGILSSLFYVMPIVFSFIFGKLSDIKGRKFMIILGYLLCAAGLALLYLSNGAILLISAILLLSVNYSIIRPVTMALIGDVSTKSNLEFLTALFWMASNIAVVSALIISSIFLTKTIYLISLLLIGISFTALLPLLRLKTEKLKELITKEAS